MQCCRIVNGIKNKNIKNSLKIVIYCKEAMFNLTKRFCMVGTRYFESTEKVKPTFRLKVNNGEIAVSPFFFCLS